MATDIFRVYAYDLNTNTLITELPASNLSFDARLNDAGGISFDLAISRPSVASRVKPLMAYSGNPFAVYVDHDGIIVWSGIIWTWNYSRASGILSLGGKEFLSYFAIRTIAADYSPLSYPATTLTANASIGATALTVASNTGYVAGQTINIDTTGTTEKRVIASTGGSTTINITAGLSSAHTSGATIQAVIDPAALVKKAIEDAQNVSLAGAGSNIGITVSGGTSTIPPIIPGYALTQRVMVSNVVRDMASINSVGNGTVDSTISSSWVAGSPSTVMTIWSPRAGRIGSASGITIDLSRVIDYAWTTDATSMGTTIYATGGSSGVSTTVNSSAPIGGLGQLPHLDKVASFSNVQTQDQLSIMAAGLPQQFGYPLPSPSATQPTSVQPLLGTFVIGDDVRLYIASDERFPSGINEYWRIVQYSVSVPDEGVPTISFVFNKPPTY